MIKENDKVTFIKDGEIKIGTVLRIYDLTDPVAVVDFDGNKEKILTRYLAKAPEVDTQENKEDKLQDPKKDEPRVVTITEAEFEEKMAKAVAKEIDRISDEASDSMIGLMLTFFGAGISGNIHKVLFGEAEND